jgi:hypothetical protein
MVITVTVFWYQHGKRFNVTLNSVQDNVLALKTAIRNYTMLAFEHIQLVCFVSHITISQPKHINL